MVEEKKYKKHLQFPHFWLQEYVHECLEPMIGVMSVNRVYFKKTNLEAQVFKIISEKEVLYCQN